MEKSIEEILKEKVSLLGEEIFDLLLEKNKVDELLEHIQLDKSDEDAIEKEIKELGGDMNE